ncbi:MAG: phosphopyruvate hydratase [Planctomycetota bacterium]
MSAITEIDARTVLDSRGNPTVEVDLFLESGSAGRAAVPSGASTGEAEAVELRDGGEAWGGLGVERALANIRGEIREAVTGLEALDQEALDRRLVDLDGTPNKKRLGANAILAVSMAASRAAADECQLPLYRYLGGPSACRLPIPLLNVINGGAHASNNLDIQEFMVAPVGAADFPTAIRQGCEVYQHLKKRLQKLRLSTTVGDEGGFAPDLSSDEEALELIVDAIQDAGFSVGVEEDFALALDVAASELHQEGRYSLRGESMESAGLVEHYRKLSERFPLVSIEDGMDENDWAGWQLLTENLGGELVLVGDDLLVTHPARLQRAVRERAANGILIKLNQIGTVTETLTTIRLAQQAGFRVVISHRSGETEDHYIADLATATGAGWIKAGAPCRSDRNAKYNRMLRIHEELGSSAGYGPLC